MLGGHRKEKRMAKNRLARTLSIFDKLPTPLRVRATSLFMGRMVPFVGTSHVRIEEMTPRRVVVSVPNHPSVRNHIKGIHAAAMTLAAETATGFVVGMNVPDDRLPLMKSLKVAFRRRLQGGLRVEAWLTEPQIDEIRREEKGEVLVSVRATDDSGQEPIECEMIWAWVPKKR
jgi:acyl-coenzyme A thioesterase PaaI-like protein